MPRIGVEASYRASRLKLRLRRPFAASWDTFGTQCEGSNVVMEVAKAPEKGRYGRARAKVTRPVRSNPVASKSRGSAGRHPLYPLNPPGAFCRPYPNDHTAERPASASRQSARLGSCWGRPTCAQGFQKGTTPSPLFLGGSRVIATGPFPCATSCACVRIHGW